MERLLARNEELETPKDTRWPDKASRDAAWPGDNISAKKHPQIIQKAIENLNDCLDPERKFSEICMKLVDDLKV